MEEKDRAIKQAVRRQNSCRLPSNFGYRTMNRIREEVYLKEKKAERRIFIAWIITVSAMLAGVTGYLVWIYGDELMAFGHRLKTSLPAPAYFRFYLPMIAPLPLLWLFNLWLKKKWIK